MAEKKESLFSKLFKSSKSGCCCCSMQIIEEDEKTEEKHIEVNREEREGK